MKDSFNTRDQLSVNGKQYEFRNLTLLNKQFSIKHLPFSLKILLENLLRHENDVDVTKEDIAALCQWQGNNEKIAEIAFTPARVLLQDFTGVPAVVDLAAMRDAITKLGKDAALINPLSPAELVIDHSVQVDNFGKSSALDLNSQLEFKRNQERYEFLKWGQQAFDNFQVVPPNTGIVHQVNLEYLARVAFGMEKDGKLQAYPDTLVGTDSHTTMINGLGVLGWGVGGIEAEAAMLGQPISMLIPEVVGFNLHGKLPEGATATDLVLTITEILRSHGVVGKFVEFFGSGLSSLPLADRATIANMAPEYGATCGIFPIDNETLDYLKLSGRKSEQIELIESYYKAQGMFHDENTEPATYSALLKLDISTVEPSLAGPKRPQDRIKLSQAQDTFKTDVVNLTNDQGNKVAVEQDGKSFELNNGDIVIAAITSCTNTSNPAVMVGAGLLARNAANKGLNVKPWVKTSLAPGSKVVTDYLNKANLTDDLEKLGFYTVGYGCTTCIGNSGPLPEEISHAIRDSKLVTCSVLSGNRNFEGRVHPQVKMNYLASPPLVVAYAIAGTMNIDLYHDPLGKDNNGNPVYLKDIWPSNEEIRTTIASCVDSNMFQSSYNNVFQGDAHWASITNPDGDSFAWSNDSTYIKNPPYFENLSLDIAPIADINNARCIALLGDSITTDHISPAGAIAVDSPAGKYLQDRHIEQQQFNSYGSRRGNHEIMMRGTFANIRLRNQLAPGTEGGWTTHFPSNEQSYIYDAAMRYQADNVPLVVLAGKEYGTGSSRDWAAKGTCLLGIKAVIAESYERIHRSNLVGMGVLPLQFKPGENAEKLGLSGQETFNIANLDNGNAKVVDVTATDNNGKTKSFQAMVRIDTPKEVEYFQHGGILHYVLRQLAA